MTTGLYSSTMSASRKITEKLKDSYRLKYSEDTDLNITFDPALDHGTEKIH